MEPTLDQHGLDLYDELIKKFIENLGDIADVVPNEVIKALWDREIKFSDLVPVSGERHLTPCSRDVNFEHFVNIFYDIEKVKANAVTFTATYPNDSFTLSLSRRAGNPILFQIVDDQLKRWYYDKESIEAAPGESIQIVGLEDERYGFSSQFTIDVEHTVDVSGNIMSLIDIIGYSRVIPCEGCFSFLFKDTPIYDASHLLLPATTLKPWCYECMLSGCVYLEGAPELPAEHLAEGCYSEMLRNCSSLTKAPELPATILAVSCYAEMFRNCSSLTKAPILPAKTLVSNCYFNMFRDCSHLSKITCLAEERSIGSTGNWIANVSSAGTFIKSPNADFWNTGISNIPRNWNVIDYGVEEEDEDIELEEGEG